MLARKGARVESVELDRRAVAYAERTGPPASRHAGAVEATARTLADSDLVVTNPPRTGMDAAVPAVLQQRRPGRIVYVSCDPATLARDLVRLAPAYRLSEARCFDLFPQTAHVETVAVLERA
jgi:23S rRNA (uracil1939-C5)-methyltransferase